MGVARVESRWEEEGDCDLKLIGEGDGNLSERLPDPSGVDGWHRSCDTDPG